ncbi:hypothetical protein [Paludibacter sp.]|uniref:hypothetical protein n=1 Tax=Paludibacter sp. TaxID=1898105 RepID=UPI0013542778|nr:hypothetical protein [Paludibacter sp.]MTK52905.1 hypothetical protein [Paludibacter sp.]
MLAYKFVALGLALSLSGTTISGAEYRGDQSRSPFMRFLHNLFWGGSGTASTFNHQSQGQTYRFSALSLGSSKTGASVASGSSTQQDIWADYGKDNSSVVTSRKPVSGRVGISGRVAVNGAVSATAQSDGYISPLASAAAVSSATSSSGSVSSSFAEATSVGMPSLLAFQTTKQTLATTSVSKASQATTNGDGWGDDPAEPMPVGDGTMTMIILAALYVYFNRKRLVLQVNPI